MGFDRLKGEVRWKREGTQLVVTAPSVRFSNADAQGAETERADAPPGHRPEFRVVAIEQHVE